MNRTEELEIINTLLERTAPQSRAGHSTAKPAPGWFSLHSMAGLPEIDSKPGSIYIDESRFAAESERIFRPLPMAVAFSAEIAPGSFIRRRVFGLDLLFARDGHASIGNGNGGPGRVQAMYNICRHRAARLCVQRSGRGKIVCPYHAWVYDLTGKRTAAPGAEGFDESEVRLHTLPTVERHGIVWIRINGSPLTASDVDNFLGEAMSSALEEMQLAKHNLLDVTEKDENVNWKLAVEGGLENYHFGPTHAATVGSQFWEQAGGLVRLGDHLRFVTPRRSIDKLRSAPESKRRLRPHAFITFLIMPYLNIFLERRHVAIHLVLPQSAGSLTMINISLVPEDTRTETKTGAYFQAAHDHTNAVLEEDYTIHRSQMDSIRQIPDLRLSFGKQEAGIKVLHHWLDSLLS